MRNAALRVDSISLREVTREAGVSPTAFYRHFDSIEALGLALVDESFVSLRAMLRDIRSSDPSAEQTVPPAPWYGLMDSSQAAMRYSLGHFIEELARHAGHADIIRESIDGQKSMG